MNVVGNGVDIIENKRIQKSLKKKEFLNRIFTKKEIVKSKSVKNKVNYFAKRFAAKEAFVKALGIGFRDGINLSNIEIRNSKLGMPSIVISKFLKKKIIKKFKLKKFKVFLSISDEKNYAIANVIITK